MSKKRQRNPREQAAAEKCRRNKTALFVVCMQTDEKKDFSPPPLSPISCINKQKTPTGVPAPPPRLSTHSTSHPIFPGLVVALVYQPSDPIPFSFFSCPSFPVPPVPGDILASLAGEKKKRDRMPPCRCKNPVCSPPGPSQSPPPPPPPAPEPNLCPSHLLSFVGLLPRVLEKRKKCNKTQEAKALTGELLRPPVRQPQKMEKETKA